MEKVAVNNLVLTLSKMLKGERFILYRKLRNQIKTLESSRGPEAEKKKEKAQRFRQQSPYLMKADLRSVARQALGGEEPWQSVLDRSDSTDKQRIEARLIGRPKIQQVVNEFRSANPDWKEWLPKLFEDWDEQKEECKARIGVEIPVVSDLSKDPATTHGAAPKVKVKKNVVPKSGKAPSSPAVKPPLKKKTAAVASDVASGGAKKPPRKKKVATASPKTAPTDSVEVVKEVVSEGAEATATHTPKPRLMGKIMHGAGSAELKAGEQLCKEGEPSSDVQPKRKFAAGDPFFWPSEETGSEDGGQQDAGPARPPFGSPTKQRLPPPPRGGPLPRRSFDKSATPPFKRRHSTAFGPGPNKRGQPPGFKKPGLPTAKFPRSASKDTSGDSDLHPSWAARRQAQKAVVAFEGKKITFS